jgi:hypothetical protein
VIAATVKNVRPAAMLLFQPRAAASCSKAAFVAVKICLISARSSGVSPRALANVFALSPNGGSA